MQEAVDAARRKEGVKTVDGHLVQYVKDENGEEHVITHSDEYKNSGY